MANTIVQSANVYTPKRDVAPVAPAELRSTAKVEPSKAAEAIVGETNRVTEAKNAVEAERPTEVKNASDLASKLTDLAQAVKRNLEFSVDDDTGQQVVRVIDTDTGELVRQIPEEHVLRMISQLQETQGSLSPGVLLDDTF